MPLGRISGISRSYLGHISTADLDVPLGLTYLYFAAEGGAVGAQLALGYRHLLGVQMAKVSYRSYRFLSIQ